MVDSEPEPDITVVRGDRRDYADRHPGPEDIALIVEVSDSTLNRDQTAKKKVYALANIPVYWIINLPANYIEVYTQPGSVNNQPDYQHSTHYGLNESVRIVLENREVGQIEVSNLLSNP